MQPQKKQSGKVQSREMQSTWSRLALVAGLALASVPAIAGAGEVASAEVRQAAASSEDLLTPFGEYFLAGGGVTNYIDGAVRNKVDVGGTWDARLGFGSRFYVGAEAAYVGSARQSGSIGSNLVTNGVEGVVRVQYPYVTGKWLIEPFAFGGAGWTHFELNRAAAGVRSTDDVLVVPFGGGIAAAYEHFLFDARFTYRQTFDEALLETAAGAPNLSSWAVTASLGYEF